MRQHPHVLITSGGTREPIDGVRVIANDSTGATGAILADAFAAAGARVTLLCARNATLPHDARIVTHTFVTVDDLDRACATELAAQHIDVVIHAAAVSDFVVDAVVVNGVRHQAPIPQKLSSQDSLSIELKPGKKILPHLKSYSQNPAMKLVGFKLTDGATDDEIARAVAKVRAAGADLVIHNDVKRMAAVRAHAWPASGLPIALPTAADLAAYLLKFSAV